MSKITNDELNLLIDLYGNHGDSYTDTVIARAAEELKELRVIAPACTCENCKNGQRFTGAPSIFCKRHGIYKTKEGYCNEAERRAERKDGEA